MDSTTNYKYQQKFHFTIVNKEGFFIMVQKKEK